MSESACSKAKYYLLRTETLQRKITFLVTHNCSYFIYLPSSHPFCTCTCALTSELYHFSRGVCFPAVLLCVVQQYINSLVLPVTIKSPAITSRDFRSHGKHNSRNKMIDKDIYAVIQKVFEIVAGSYFKEWGLLFRCGFQYMFHIKMFVL